MTPILRIFAKDLVETIGNVRGLITLLVAPTLIVVLIGQLRTQPPELTVLMAGVPECGEAEDASSDICQIRRLLQEISYVSLRTQLEREYYPRQRLEADHIDLLINIDASSDQSAPWLMYTAETVPRRLPWLSELARGIRASRWINHAGDETNSSAGLLMLAALGGWIPLRSVVHFYPKGGDHSVALLPGSISIIICLLPFVVVASSLIRERDARTIETLLAVPDMTGRSIFLGKLLVAIAVSLLSLLLMVITIQIIYDVYISVHTLQFLLLLGLPVLSSALIGMAVSAIARTHAQTIGAAAVYFFCLLLLTGFLYPTSESSDFIRLVSHLFPLTFVLEPAYSWVFGANFGGSMRASVFPLIVQILFFGAIATYAWWLQLRKL